MIAMALMCGPALILADEPTTALDVTIQAQILHLLAELQREFAMGLVLITHDLGVVARIATRVVVMYAGEVVETGPAAAIFSDARASLHARAAGLHPGARPHAARRSRWAPSPAWCRRSSASMRGCHFAGRCPHVVDACRAVRRPARGGRGDGHRVRCIRHAEIAAWRRVRRTAWPSHEPRCAAIDRTADRRRCSKPATSRRTFRVSAGMLRRQAHAARRRRREPRRPAGRGAWRWSASPAAARPRWRACCSGCCPRRRARSASTAGRPRHLAAGEPSPR